MWKALPIKIADKSANNILMLAWFLDKSHYSIYQLDYTKVHWILNGIDKIVIEPDTKLHNTEVGQLLGVIVNDCKIDGLFKHL